MRVVLRYAPILEGAKPLLFLANVAVNEVIRPASSQSILLVSLSHSPFLWLESPPWRHFVPFSEIQMRCSAHKNASDNVSVASQLLRQDQQSKLVNSLLVNWLAMDLRRNPVLAGIWLDR